MNSKAVLLENKVQRFTFVIYEHLQCQIKLCTGP